MIGYVTLGTDDLARAIAFYERVGFAEDAVVSMGKRLERQRS